MKTIALPFEKIESIRASILRLNGLVAIFSQSRGDRFLHVYLSEYPLPPCSDKVDVIALQDLPDKNLSEFDGLVAGFSVLDIVRDDIVVQGAGFFPMEQFYVERNQLSALDQTKEMLAVHLVERLLEYTKQKSPDTLRKAQAGIIKTILPVHLSRRDCKNLTAVFPQRDLRAFVQSGEAVYIFADKRISNNNLDVLAQMRVDTDRDWVIALEEMSFFNPLIKPAGTKFLDLRDVLRRSGNETCLQQTYKQLGLICHEEEARDHRLKTVSISLLSQCWLAGEDVDDLVAFCPHNDFDHFAETGAAIRVYRTLSDRERSGLSRNPTHYSMLELLQKGLPDNYGRVMLSFPIVWKHLKEPSSSELLDLGGVLSKAGKIHQLARCLYMISYSLAKGRSSLPDEVNFTPDLEDLIDTAYRAYLIYNLSDPWVWGARWSVDLENAQRFLIDLVKVASQSADHPINIFYTALLQWLQHSNYTVDSGSLNNTLSTLRSFQRLLHEDNRTGLDHYLKRSTQLIEICESLLEQSGSYVKETNIEPQDEGRIGVLDVSRTLDILVNLSGEYGPVTSLFLKSWSALLRLRRQLDDLRLNERDVERLILFLQWLSMQLKLEQHLICAPLHEHQILDFAYQRESYRIESILQELESSAKLDINLKNPWLDLHQDVNLVLDITNTGQVEADGLEVRFTPSRSYQPLEEKSIFEISVLQPSASTEINYRIRPEQTDVELRLEYEFQDRRGQKHNDTWTARLNIRNLDLEPFQIKVNRYQFGRPIQIPSDFYGRRYELQNILSHLRGGGQQNLLLRGPRRMGKTSLLYILQHLLKHPETRRLFDIPVTWDTELNRHRPVFLSLHAFDFYSGMVQIIQFFRTLLDSVLKALDVANTESSSFLDDFEQRQLQVGPVNAALEQIGRVMDSHPGMQVVVLLDEYDEIYRPRSGGLDRGLREFVSAEQRLTWIIASTLALFEAVKSVSSPWFNIFAIIELQRLTQKAAVDLVEKPSHGEGVVWRSDAVLDLLRETGNHPAFTQLFCEKLMEYLNQSQTNYVTRETIAIVTDQIVNEQETAHSHFEFYWSDTPGVGQLILLLLNDQGVPLRRDEIRSSVLRYLDREFGDIHRRRVKDSFNEVSEWWSREFKSGIDWVDKITDALSPDDQRRYVFSVPLFRNWLRKRALHEDLWEAARDKMLKEMERDGLVNS